jgi:hypothetical protein
MEKQSLCARISPERIKPTPAAHTEQEEREPLWRLFTGIKPEMKAGEKAFVYARLLLLPVFLLLPFVLYRNDLRQVSESWYAMCRSM